MREGSKAHLGLLAKLNLYLDSISGYCPENLQILFMKCSCETQQKCQCFRVSAVEHDTK